MGKKYIQSIPCILLILLYSFLSDCLLSSLNPSLCTQIHVIAYMLIVPDQFGCSIVFCTHTG